MGHLTVTKFNDLVVSQIFFITIIFYLPSTSNAHSAYSVQRYSEFPPLSENKGSNSQFFSHPLNRVIKQEQKRQFLDRKGSIYGRNNQQNEQLKSQLKDVTCFPLTESSAAALSDHSVYVYNAAGKMFLCKQAADKYAHLDLTMANRYRNADLSELYGNKADLLVPKYDSQNNRQENKVPVKRRTEYDFIRFGRSDPLLATPHYERFIRQETKQEDKKASGPTYDYIRFGKRSSPN